MDEVKSRNPYKWILQKNNSPKEDKRGLKKRPTSPSQDEHIKKVKPSCLAAFCLILKYFFLGHKTVLRLGFRFRWRQQQRRRIDDYEFICKRLRNKSK